MAVASRQRLLGRLMAAAGRPQEALPPLVAALPVYVRNRHWANAALICERACDAAKTLEAADRGPYLQAIAAALRPALPDTVHGSAIDMRLREEALDRCAGALLDAGAEDAARDVLAAKVRQQEERQRLLGRSGGS